jgi:FtsP/CotA-like multicopper oxidase with cupredoxin domain
MRRRAFVQGLAASGVLLAAPRLNANGPSIRRTLTGTQFDLDIGEMPVNFTGKRRHATVVNGQLPAPLLIWREGETVTIRVRNRLATRTSIHWHGLIVPADMDGVPGISFHGIAPGETFTYRFKVNQSGTYWYHAHSAFQEQVGLYGPIIVLPRSAPRHSVERDYTVLLSDWTDEDPMSIYRKLKLHSGYYNNGKRTVSDWARDIRERGWNDTLAERRMWSEMRMQDTDLADVSAQSYTYLMNGASSRANWQATFARGERVRLRIINGASMTFFDLRIPDLRMKVIAADGQEIDPITVDELRIGPAEVYDVIVEPNDDRAYAIFAQSMDRSGFVHGTLTPQPGLTAAVPAVDARVALSMGDMGMQHGEHAAHAGHSAPVTHSREELGPGVDMRVSQPNDSLSDPGVGLRSNGRRVLTYADLHTLGGPIDRRDPTREIELHLTGHMERFMWSFNGAKFSDAEPLQFNYGERLRIALVNDTMMTHPIHLHGMWSEVESPQGEFQVRKHTVNVQPAQRLKYLVTADALGRWAYHCHLLYHMEAGMFREVVVSASARSGA